jgi:ADP-ribose pyrophosphatase
MPLPKTIQKADSEVLFEGDFIRVRTEDHWEYVERRKSSGVVAILAVTDNQELILVEQFRFPVNKRVIATPAGLAGDIKGQEGESLVEAARRELLEETGFEAQAMEYLTVGPTSAGLSTELVTLFRAWGLKRVSGGGGDNSENIQVHVVPLVSLKPWLESKRSEGCLVDYKVYAALYLSEITCTGKAIRNGDMALKLKVP